MHICTYATWTRRIPETVEWSARRKPGQGFHRRNIRSVDVRGENAAASDVRRLRYDPIRAYGWMQA